MRPAQAALLAALILTPRLALAQEDPASPTPDSEPSVLSPNTLAAPTLAPPVPPLAPAAPPSLPERLGEVPGTWDLSRDGTNRRCVMTLRIENGEAGQRVSFPAGCRRALPIVGGVAGWLFNDRGVRLVDRNVRPILEFVRRPDQRSLVAKTESGEVYSLVPLDIAAMRPPAATPDSAGVETAPAPLQTAPAVPSELQRTATATAPAASGPTPGVYALDRFQERDTCRITLDGAGGGVHIVPGCHDGGLEVFDPVRWRYANGRMTLTAKRGHSIDLVASGDGRWRREPEVGTTFVLRRVD